MKKLFYGLGAIAAVATPVVAVVSCGSSSNAEVSWTKVSTLADFQKVDTHLNQALLTKIQTALGSNVTSIEVSKFAGQDQVHQSEHHTSSDFAILVKGTPFAKPAGLTVVTPDTLGKPANTPSDASNSIWTLEGKYYKDGSSTELHSMKQNWNIGNNEAKDAQFIIFVQGGQLDATHILKVFSLGNGQFGFNLSAQGILA